MTNKLEEVKKILKMARDSNPEDESDILVPFEDFWAEQIVKLFTPKPSRGFIKCPKCGSKRPNKQATVDNRYKFYKCKDCGYEWMRH